MPRVLFAALAACALAGDVAQSRAIVGATTNRVIGHAPNDALGAVSGRR